MIFWVISQTCCILERSRLSSKTDKILIRCTKSFNLENFLFDLNSLLSSNKFDSKTSRVDNDVKYFNHTFISVLNKHVPLRNVTRKEIKLNSKHRITKGLLTFIKTGNNFSKTMLKATIKKIKLTTKSYLDTLTQYQVFSKTLVLLKTNQRETSRFVQNVENYRN